MSNSALPKMYGIRMLPLLVGIAIASLAAAAALMFVLARGPETSASPDGARLAVLSQSLPLRALAAVRGEEQAFGQLADARKQLDAALASARAADPKLAAEGSWKTLLDGATTVGEAKEAATTISTAARQVRELTPRLLAELGNLSGVMGGAKVDGLARHLERFELNVQRVQQDLDSLASGSVDTAGTAQRIADGTDYLGQVLRGMAGEDSGLG